MIFFRDNQGFLLELSEFECLEGIDRSTLEIELWSGLTDCYGNKIYENDILDSHSSRLLVRYEKGQFIVNDRKNPFCSLATFLILTKEARVIGNIHENADLLNDKD